MKCPLPKIIKLGTIFIRIPPHISMGAAKIVRVSREGVDIHFTPPLVGGGKMKINRTLTQAEEKIFKNVVPDIKIALK